MMLNGEASPGTLESRVAAGAAGSETGPTANPFHSEKIRAEIDLVRARPVALASEKKRMQKDIDEAGLGDPSTTGPAEPDYARAFGQAEEAREVPRVARIEPAGCGPVEGPVLSEAARESCNSKADVVAGGSASNEPSHSPAPGGDTPEAMKVVVPPGIAAEDPRELIPEPADRLSRVEALCRRSPIRPTIAHEEPWVSFLKLLRRWLWGNIFLKLFR